MCRIVILQLLQKKLINKGFVTRSRSTSDRRVVYLEITEQGKDLVAKMEDAKKQYLQERFSALSEDEMNVMISISKKTYLSDYKQEKRLRDEIEDLPYIWEVFFHV